MNRTAPHRTASTVSSGFRLSNPHRTAPAVFTWFETDETASRPRKPHRTRTASHSPPPDMEDAARRSAEVRGEGTEVGGGEGRVHVLLGGRRRRDARSEPAADMEDEDPDTEGFLEDGGVNGEGTAVRDGEVAAARKNWTSPHPRRRQFRTPQVRLPCILTLYILH